MIDNGNHADHPPIAIYDRGTRRPAEKRYLLASHLRTDAKDRLGFATVAEDPNRNCLGRDEISIFIACNENGAQSCGILGSKRERANTR